LLLLLPLLLLLLPAWRSCAPVLQRQPVQVTRPRVIVRLSAQPSGRQPLT